MQNNACTRNWAMVFVGFGLLTGLIVGAGMALLLAPQSGARTRRQMRDFADEVGEQAHLMTENAKRAASDVIKKGKQLVG